MFDENDFESLYFQGLDFDDARKILIDEEEGVFLIRDSSRGGYVICVKEDDDVSQYTVNVKEIGGQTNFYVREECPFTKFPTLLSFYKRNIFKSAHLSCPVSRERVVLRRTCREGSDRSNARSEFNPGHHHMATPQAHLRQSAPPDMLKPYDPFRDDQPPLYARVLKAREPRAYTKDLPLKVNDLIRVTAKSISSGTGTGVLNGVTGEFPLINVEFVKQK